MLLPNKGTYNKMFGTTGVRDLLMSSKCAKTAGWQGKYAHSSMCTAGPVRQNGIWFCPYLLNVHLQKGCPDLMTSEVILYQSEFLVFLQNFKNGYLQVFA